MKNKIEFFLDYQKENNAFTKKKEGKEEKKEERKEEKKN